MSKTKNKTVYSIEDRGGYWASGFADGFLKEADLADLISRQDTLIRAVIQLEEAIRRRRPASERKALSVDISHTLKVETDEENEFRNWRPAVCAALLMAVENCDMDAEPEGDWQDDEDED